MDNVTIQHFNSLFESIILLENAHCMLFNANFIDITVYRYDERSLNFDE